MKFVKSDGNEIILQESFSTVSKDISPFKEIITRKDFSDFVYQDDQIIPLTDVVPIHINVIEVGVVIFVFKKEQFQKETFVSEVSRLKELQLNSFYDVIGKIKALYETSLSFNPLFSIYIPVGKHRVYEECFKTFGFNVKTIYISNADTNVIVNKSAESTNIYKKNPVIKTEKKHPFNFVNPFTIIKKDKFHFLFALIATFLIGFTAAIGVFDAYQGKMICIFFFICSLAGSFLNYMIYKDSFKNNELFSPFSIITMIASIIGIGLSFGAYALFKKISLNKDSVIPSFILIFGIIILAFVISALTAYLVSYLKKRKK